MKPRSIVAAAAILLGIGTAHADSCRRTEAEMRAGRPCPPDRRVVPYDPDRTGTGRRSGPIDLGNGTEIRVGGRVRTEYDLRR